VPGFLGALKACSRFCVLNATRESIKNGKADSGFLLLDVASPDGDVEPVKLCRHVFYISLKRQELRSVKY
jgi:hypothetical protein